MRNISFKWYSSRLLKLERGWGLRLGLRCGRIKEQKIKRSCHSCYLFSKCFERWRGVGMHSSETTRIVNCSVISSPASSDTVWGVFVYCKLSILSDSKKANEVRIKMGPSPLFCPVRIFCGRWPVTSLPEWASLHFSPRFFACVFPPIPTL